LVVLGHRHYSGLTQQPDYQTARKYWNKLKERLGKEGSESVTKCNRLKLPATTTAQEVEEKVNDARVSLMDPIQALVQRRA
jgi:hypothetical protein